MPVIRSNTGARARIIACRNSVAGAVAAALLGAPWGSAAATAAEPAPRHATARQSFSIPAGPLAPALRELAGRAGVLLSFTPQQTEGRRTGGIDGEYSVEQAFAALLAGSGLAAVHNPGGGYSLRAAAGDAALLPTLRVGGVVAESAWGPVPGYVASRSSTGSKTDTPLLEVPQSVSVVGGAEMRDRNAQSVVQAIEYLPGVQVNNFGGNEIRNDWIVLRGFDAKLSGDYRDGLSQLPFDQIRSRTPAYGLERVEVIRGPSSVLFGQVAPGGLVNRITKRPGAERLREVQLQVGSFEHYQGAFDLGDDFDGSGRYLYRLTGVYRDSGTQDRYDGDHRYTDDSRYIAPAFTWNLDDATSLTVLASYQYDENDGESRPVYPTRHLVGDYSYDTNQREVSALGYLLEHRLDERWTLRQNARYQRGDIELRNLYSMGLADGHIVKRYALASRQEMRGLVVDNQAEGRLRHGRFEHTLLAGLDYKRLNAEAWYSNGPAPDLDLWNPVYGQFVAYPAQAGTWLDQSEFNEQLGVYLQDQIVFDQRWIVTLGGRFDRAESRVRDNVANRRTRLDDDAFTGRVGLSYRVGNGVVPYVSYATSFQPQSGSDYHGKVFEPTTGEQWEAGLKYQPDSGDRLLALSVFELTQQKVLTSDPDPLHGNFSVQTGEIRSRGLELEARADLANGFDVVASYTYTDVEVTKSNNADLGNTPVVTPEHMASAWLNYSFDRFGAGFGARYVGSTYVNNTNTWKNDAATVFDASAWYESGPWRFELNAGNLFDKETVVCRNSDSNCRYGIERRLVGTAAYRW